MRLTIKNQQLGALGAVVRLAVLSLAFTSFPAGAAEELVQVAGSGAVELTMIVIEPGEFLMGSPSKEPGRAKREGPQVVVSFSTPFAVSKTEITVAQFAAFIAATAYETDAERKGTAEVFNFRDGLMVDKAGASWRNNFNGDDADGELPVIRVSWNDAHAFTKWLAEDTGKPYRLLSESEFEYAVRAGTTSPYWWGVGTPKNSVENVAGSKERTANLKWPVAFKGYSDRFWGPAPVASFAPNPFGLHDMSGNAAEWVADCYVALDQLPANGVAYEQDGCPMYVFRGAAWAYPPPFARSAYRNAAEATHSSATISFRVALDMERDIQSQAQR